MWCSQDDVGNVLMQEGKYWRYFKMQALFIVTLLHSLLDCTMFWLPFESQKKEKVDAERVAARKL